MDIQFLKYKKIDYEILSLLDYLSHKVSCFPFVRSLSF